jgi:hypothetical protein
LYAERGTLQGKKARFSPGGWPIHIEKQGQSAVLSLSSVGFLIEKIGEIL